MSNAQIKARDAIRQRLFLQVPGLTSWIVYEPKHPDTDLWLNCIVAAYNANPTELWDMGGKHWPVADKMYRRLVKAEDAALRGKEEQ